MLDFVIFDYDGTLLDSLEITYQSFRKAFFDLGYGDMSLEFFRKEFSMNHDEMYRKMGVEEGKAREVESVWWDYWEKMRGGIRLFPQTIPALEKLRSLGVGMGIVSDGKGVRVRGDLAKFGIEKFFSVVVVREDVSERKPSPKSLLAAVERIRKDCDKCVYVGDRVEDIQAGRAAGMLTGCVCNGTHKLEWMLEEKPDFIFTDVGAVPEIFE